MSSKFTNYLPVIVAIALGLALLAAPLLPVTAASHLVIPVRQETALLDAIVAIFTNFASLAGMTALIVALVNLGKQIGIIKDDQAGGWYAAFSLLGIAALVALRIFIPDIGLDFMDAQAQKIAMVLVVIGGYLGMLVAGKPIHTTFTQLNLPGIGKSYSKDKS